MSFSSSFSSFSSLLNKSIQTIQHHFVGYLLLWFLIVFLGSLLLIQCIVNQFSLDKQDFYFHFDSFWKRIHREGMENEDDSTSSTSTATNIPSDTGDTDYQPYDANDPMILAKQNAGNIEYLKQRFDDLKDLPQIVNDLSGNMQNLNDQMVALTQSQSATLDQINSVATSTLNPPSEDEDEE